MALQYEYPLTSSSSSDVQYNIFCSLECFLNSAYFSTFFFNDFVCIFLICCGMIKCIFISWNE